MEKLDCGTWLLVKFSQAIVYEPGSRGGDEEGAKAFGLTRIEWNDKCIIEQGSCHIT